eukprot:14131902-Heterocapsa_arctica.AAC.1
MTSQGPRRQGRTQTCTGAGRKDGGKTFAFKAKRTSTARRGGDLEASNGQQKPRRDTTRIFNSTRTPMARRDVSSRQVGPYPHLLCTSVQNQPKPGMSVTTRRRS